MSANYGRRSKPLKVKNVISSLDIYEQMAQDYIVKIQKQQENFDDFINDQMLLANGYMEQGN